MPLRRQPKPRLRLKALPRLLKVLPRLTALPPRPSRRSSKHTRFCLEPGRLEMTARTGARAPVRAVSFSEVIESGMIEFRNDYAWTMSMHIVSRMI
jgi:hypothetical protein